MELRTLVRALRKTWWIILAAFVVTFGLTSLFTFTRARTYRSTATFIVAPNAAFEDVKSFVSGLDILSRRTEIAATYAEVVGSSLIKQEAAAELDLSNAQKKGLAASGRLRPGTNVMEITAEGNHPVLVRDFANMVGAKTRTYVQGLYELYDLIPLDEAALPSRATSPNHAANLALGAILGLALGGGLAFVLEYLQAPLEPATSFQIVDETTGAYNRRYFVQRLGAEIARAERNKYPLSLALMNFDRLDVTFAPAARAEIMRKVSALLSGCLRKEDVFARVDDTTFALLMLDMPEEEAKAMVEELLTRIAEATIEVEQAGVNLNLRGATGVAAYQHDGTGQEDFLSQAGRALEQEGAGGNSEVHLLPRDGEQQ